MQRVKRELGGMVGDTLLHHLWQILPTDLPLLQQTVEQTHEGLLGGLAIGLCFG
jgi:hypothetical protein